MPSLKSSSKSGKQLVLFATERRHLNETRYALEWVAEQSDDPDLAKLCSDTCDGLTEVLRRLPAQERATKEPAAQAGT